ncbi:MAG: hypothetical protein E7461_07320 [Ruminococcaceae bacterium]|nr:hypothetical protein [Oscillospiraceae bacterium]
MIRIKQIPFPPEHNAAQLSFEAAKLLRISPSKIRKLSIVRRSIDARKKPDVKIVYTVDVAVDGSEKKILKESRCKQAELTSVPRYKPPKNLPAPSVRPVVIGFGPAGMFAALILALAGQKPLVLERGDDAITRKEKVDAFFAGGKLDTRSNVQFGEGGAGTFSDGKLNTGVNNPRLDWVLEQMVKAGAGEDILFDAKPHVGTDVLLTVVQNIRKRIIELGGEVRFHAQVTDLFTENGRLSALEINKAEKLPCQKAVLSIGHSARDTFEKLFSRNIPMEAKPFSMGVRIEHKQETVNLSQYGCNSPVLPPASYKLVQHLDGRTVYSFCMCPGGYVVAAASEEGGIVTNGMSNANREGDNANAAILVGVSPGDFPKDGPLAGMYWQREIERKAYSLTNSYCAPAQRLEDFLSGRPTKKAGDISPTYRPGVHYCDLHQVLPPVITDALKEAMVLLDRQLPGFCSPDAILTAPETRSSSPVRILRGEDRASVGLPGLYPAGEGAGYAGGIMSAAIDGILSAEAMLTMDN